jgi:hypothetical protein
VRKVTIFFLTAATIGFFSLTSCTKNTTTTVNHPDSVYTSSWVTLAVVLNATDSLYEENITAPAITSAILQDGVILGYGAYINTGNQDTVESAALEFGIYQTFSVGNILIQSVYQNSGLFYRYVIVPGHVLTTKGLTPQQAKNLSYAEATKLFGSAASKSTAPAVQ